jgi:hypothetical protein
MRPTLTHDARQALIRNAHAERSALLAAMLKRVVFFLLSPLRSRPPKQEARRTANLRPMQGAV